MTDEEITERLAAFRKITGADTFELILVPRSKKMTHLGLLISVLDYVLKQLQEMDAEARTK